MGRSLVRISMAASMALILSQPSFSQVEPNTQDPNAINRNYVYQRYAIGGKKSTFARIYSLQLDCTPDDWQEVTLTKQSENGEAKIVEASTIIDFPASNARSKCNGKSTNAQTLYYTPNKGYTGDDSIVVEVINSGGQRTTYTYNITVK